MSSFEIGISQAGKKKAQERIGDTRMRDVLYIKPWLTRKMALFPKLIIGSILRIHAATIDVFGPSFQSTRKVDLDRYTQWK